MGFLSVQELKKIGLKRFGENVLISDKVSIYNASNISIGSHVRIDDFCILSAGEGGIQFGNHIHIACYSSLIGKGKIHLNDFSNISSRVAIYSSNDDYSGAYMTNPMVPESFTNVTHGKVIIGKHVIIGAGSVVLPKVTIEDGVAIGALSLVNQSCEKDMIYAGAPAQILKPRKKGIYEKEYKFNQNGK